MSLLRRIRNALGFSRPEKPGKPPPRLSVILIHYKMERQITNTLRSLLPPYQRGIKRREFEILLVDNGSPEPLPEAAWKLEKNIALTRIEPRDASPNPGVAINRAVANSRGEIVSIMIDGARMVSPGVLSWGLRLLELAPRALVEVRGWHLGPKNQPESILEGYTHEVETQLLLDSRWWENGYRLFNISAASAQTKNGYFAPANESNCLFLARTLFDEIGGYDERYAEPGGGLVNLDFYSRACAAATHVFTLLGEGTFHQVHGGAATGLALPKLEDAITRWSAESQNLRGELLPPDRKKCVLAGHMPDECRDWLARNLR